MKKRAFVAISVALICGLVFVGCPKPKITELEGLWNGDGALTSNWAFAENKVEYNMGLSVTVLTYTIAVNQKYTGTFTLDTAQTPKWIDLSFTDMEYTWTFSIGRC